MALLEPIPEKSKAAATKLTLVSESSTTRKLMELNLLLQLVRILSVKQVKSIAQFVASKKLVALPFLSITMAALTSLVKLHMVIKMTMSLILERLTIFVHRHHLQAHLQGDHNSFV